MLRPSVIRTIRRLASNGVSAAEIARRVRATPKTVRRYLRGGIEVEQQVRPTARALSREHERLARQLYAGAARGNATEVTRRLNALGVEVNVRTVRRTVQGVRRPLPAMSVSEAPEEYGLSWDGKGEAAALAKLVPRARLVPSEGRRRPFPRTGHVLIESDNLTALRLLEQQGLRGQVKLAFLDPPYGSGERVVFDDSGGEGDGAPVADATRRDRWLSMMYGRVIALVPLLAADGVVVVTINEARAHHARLLLDEVLGARNHAGTVIVQTVPGGRPSRKAIASVHEYLLFYAGEPRSTNAIRNPERRDSQVSGYYVHSDSEGAYGLFELRALGDRTTRGGTPKYLFPVHVSPSDGTVRLKKDRTHRIAVFPDAGDGDGRWTWSPARVERDAHLLVAKKLRSGRWRIYRKGYAWADDARAAQIKSLWTESSYVARQGTRDLVALLGARVFDFPKSVALMRRVLELTTAPNQRHVVLDVFAGSGTLGEAVFRLNAEDGGNRRYVGIQSAEPTRAGSAARAAGYETISAITRARLGTVVAAVRAKPIVDWTIGPRTRQQR